MKHALILFVLALAASVGGCGTVVALVDSQQALAIVDRTNVDNWQKVAAVQLGFYDAEGAKLETSAAAHLAGSAGGADAAKIFADYLAVRGRLAASRADAAREYGEALDNALLAAELRDRQSKLIAGWRALLGRIPGVESLRAVAESKARAYLDTLKEPSP